MIPGDVLEGRVTKKVWRHVGGRNIPIVTIDDAHRGEQELVCAPVLLRRQIAGVEIGDHVVVRFVAFDVPQRWEVEGGRNQTAAEQSRRDRIRRLKKVAAARNKAGFAGRVCPCGRPIDIERDDVDIDHITPRADGGGDEIENLRLMHASCNRSRGKLPTAEWQEKVGA